MEQKKTWQERVKELRKFHLEQVTLNSNWGIRQTAKALGWSHGSVGNYLLVADWSRSYPKVFDLPNLNAALDFIKKKKSDLRMRN